MRRQKQTLAKRALEVTEVVPLRLLGPQAAPSRSLLWRTEPGHKEKSSQCGSEKGSCRLSAAMVPMHGKQGRQQVREGAVDPVGVTTPTPTVAQKHHEVALCCVSKFLPPRWTTKWEEISIKFPSCLCGRKPCQGLLVPPLIGLNFHDLQVPGSPRAHSP